MNYGIDIPANPGARRDSGMSCESRLNDSNLHDLMTHAALCRLRAGLRCVSASGLRCWRHALNNRVASCQRRRTVARAGSTHPTLTTSIIPRPSNFVTTVVSIFLPFPKLKNRISIFYFLQLDLDD